MKKYCFDGLTGEVITKDSPLYEESRQEWNRAVEDFPIAIVYCHNKYDVKNAIIWCRKKCVEIRIRSGGHHYEGYSVGDGTLVIDISKMNKVKIKESKKLVTIESGVKNREFYEAVSSLGYPLPGGSCPTVGVVGYTLGGGWGYSSRYLGLGADSLKEVEIINYQGCIITANEKINRNLFWALKGAGGGNFGVVVSLTYNLPQKVEGVTFLSVYFTKCTKNKLINIFDSIQQALPTMDVRLTIQSNLYNSEKEGIASYTRGIFYGTKNEALEVISFLTNIEGANVYAKYLSFIEAMSEMMNGYPANEHFKSTGRFVYRQYTKVELEGIVDLIMTRPENSVFTGIGIYTLGGKVSEIPSSDTAYYYRQASYIIGIQSIWLDNEYKEQNVKWVEDKFNYIYPLTNGSFVNFPYSELKDYEKEYYGENIYFLRSIKRIYDPYNVFRFPQSISGKVF